MKKLLVSILIGITFFFSIAPYSLAKADQDSWYNQSFPDWFAKVYDQTSSPASEIFGERYTAAQVQWIFYSLMSAVINIIPGNPDFFVCITQGNFEECGNALPEALRDIVLPVYSSDTGTGKSVASEFINKTSNSSLSGIGYTKRLIEKLSPVTNVSAADNGLGYTTAGAGILQFWKVTRNVSFTFLVLAVVVIAFMIMFRVKINPQTVISIQSALPKVIATLVLITFSYAIAGFAIDLMYAVIGLLSTIISTSGLSALTPGKLFDEFLYTYDGFGLMYAYWCHFLINSFLSIFTSGNMWWAGILLLLFSIFSILVILWWSIKIIYLMIKNFAMLMISIAIGPLEIMIGAISSKIGFGSWLKRIISYLAVYPVMVVMMFFSFFFLKQGIVNGAQEEAYSTPFRPNINIISPDTWNPPFGVGTGASHNGSQVIWVFVSFFIFSQVTKAAQLVQSLFSGKPFDYGTGIGEAGNAAKWAWNQTGAPYLKTAKEIYASERLSSWEKKLKDKFNNTSEPGPGEKKK